jgi:8-oxo-dGTP pyrophosphatase MutT (NUDIX family)
LFPAVIVLPKEEPIDAAVLELLEETRMSDTIVNLTMFNNVAVRIPLPEGKYHLVYVHAASVHVPYVTANLRLPAKVEQALTSH